MSSTGTASVASLPLFSLAVITTVVFVILKLTEVVAWSWWIVFSPLIACVVLLVVCVVLFLIILMTGLIFMAIATYMDTR
jgi:hypothetical protein